MNAEHTTSLQLRRVPHPADSTRTVQAFGTREKACRHIEDHLLTAPEREVWPLVVAEDAGGLLPSSDLDCFELARSALHTQGVAAQPLYDVYCEAMADAARDACRLSWYASRPPVTVALGTSGLLLVLQRDINTAFLPGQGDAEATAASREPVDGQQQKRTGLRRQRSMLSGRRGQFSGQTPAGKRASRGLIDALERRDDRLETMPREEQLYYRVFRPAVQWLRRQYSRVRDPAGNVCRGRDYALLKEVLPPMSRLKLLSWKAFRCDPSDSTASGRGTSPAAEAPCRNPD